MRSLVLALLLILTSFHAKAEILRHHVYPLCQALFGTRIGQANELFSGYVRVSSGNELFLRVDSPGWAHPKRWILLIHGLMSSHKSYETIGPQLVEEGVGIIRVDLRGFSRSLLREWQLAREKGFELKAPTEIHFSEYVSDIIDILTFLDHRFRIRRPEIAGHSMGGGLTVALMADPRGRALLTPRETLIAPYVYRLEYRAAERFTFGNLPVSNLFALEEFTPSVLRHETERFVDFLSEPQLRAVLGVYFDDFVRAGLVDYGDEPSSQFRSLQIDYGIAAVKGLRGLNSLQLLSQLPSEVQTDLFFGTYDHIVDRGLALRLGTLVRSRGGQVIEVDAGHMIPVEKPEVIMPRILNPSPSPVSN
jgi:pimeloyl-ACP methyl ester carboxylesterase